MEGGGEKLKLRKRDLPKECPEFESVYDDIQEQLQEFCGLLTGIRSKAKGQILRVAVTLNALFSIDSEHFLTNELSSAAIGAAINYVKVCNEHVALLGGRKEL